MNALLLPPAIHECDSNMFCKRKRFVLFFISMAILIVTIPQVYYHLTWSVNEEPATNSSEEQEEDESMDDRDLAVIILANHRTGSSLTGEILALADHASYFFEPIYYTKNVLTDPSTEAQLFILRAMIECDGDLMATVQSESTVSIIRQLDGQKIKKDRGTSGNELRQMCLQSPFRVIKTIRLRLSTAQALISDMAASSITMPEIKIIHLVRDPRGMLTSLSKTATWGGAENNPANQCKALMEDLKLGRTMPKSQYQILHYEDLVENPKSTIKKLFHFMGVEEPTFPITKYLDEHMHAEKHANLIPHAGQYFLTVRNSSFDANHWRKEITPAFLAEVEDACRLPMKELGYQPISLKAADQETHQ